MGKVQRFGVSIEESLACRFDEHIRREGYSSRSEALRDLIREHLVSEKLNMDGTGAVASAVVAVLEGLVSSPVDVCTKSGEILKINFKKEDGSVSDVTLEGNAEFVFEGSLSDAV